MSIQDLQRLAAERRAKKSAGPVTSGFGGANTIAGSKFIALMNDTVAQHQWLKYGLRMVGVDPGQNVINVRNHDNLRWKHIPDEGDSNFDATVKGSDREILISCGHAVMEMAHTRRAQRRAKSLFGENTDLRREDEIGFAIALGNNLSRTAIHGDSASLDDSLSMGDGIIKKAQAEAITVDKSVNVGGVQVAIAFDPDQIFHVAMQNLAAGLRSNGLAWYGHNDLWLHWTRFLMNLGTNERYRDELAQAAITEGRMPGPMGRSALKIPDWPTDLGPSAAANTVVDDTDGTMTIGVTNVLPNANDYSGRRVRVTHVNGNFEELTVVRNGAANEVETAGFFGLGAFDATTTNYTVKVIDETSVMLTTPSNILFAMEDGIRTYREFDRKGEKQEITVHADIDPCEFVRPEGVVYLTGIYIPS